MMHPTDSDVWPLDLPGWLATDTQDTIPGGGPTVPRPPTGSHTKAPGEAHPPRRITLSLVGELDQLRRSPLLEYPLVKRAPPPPDMWRVASQFGLLATFFFALLFSYLLGG